MININLLIIHSVAGAEDRFVNTNELKDYDRFAEAASEYLNDADEVEGDCRNRKVLYHATGCGIGGAE